jgi:hypothetical protein
LVVGAVLVPLAVVLLLSAVVLIIPAAPIVAVALLAVLLVAVRGKQARAAAGRPQVEAQPDRCPLPRARARARPGHVMTTRPALAIGDVAVSRSSACTRSVNLLRVD